jgi:Zn-dependent protease
MRESIRLGRILGIPVGVNWTLLAILGLLTYDLALGLPGGPTVAAVAVAGLAAVVFFGSVLLHELAHSVVARRYGLRVDGITLWLLGGVSRLEGEAPSAGAAARIAVAGPAVSLALAVGFGVFAIAAAGLGLPAVIGAGVGWLAVINGVVAAFNLVPAAPLDGGRILGAALWAHYRDRDRGQLGAARAGRVFGWVLIGFGIWGFLSGAGIFGLWPAVLGWFVLSLADAEARYYRLRQSTRGRTVGEAMTPVRSGEPGWLTVDGFLDHVGDAHARGFVVDQWGGGPAAFVTGGTLRSVPAAARGSTRVLDVARPLHGLPVVHRGDDLLDAWARTSGPRPMLVVQDGGDIVGVVTPEDLQRAGAPTELRHGAAR